MNDLPPDFELLEGEVEDEGEPRLGDGARRDAGEDERGQEAPAPADRDPVDHRGRQQGAGEGGDGESPVEVARKTCVEGQHRSQRSARRDAQHPGIGQRIPEQPLERAAGGRQTAADQGGTENPRQPNLPHDEFDPGLRRVAGPAR